MYLNANKLLYEHQSGFRLLHSVTTALLASTNDWYLNMDKGKYTGLIFIDLRKVFDTVDHAILLKKLKKYGANGLEHEWFTSYLDNRRQVCRINSTSSQLMEITCGVPQGSCVRHSVKTKRKGFGINFNSYLWLRQLIFPKTTLSRQNEADELINFIKRVPYLGGV